MGEKRCMGCMGLKQGGGPFCEHCGFEENTPNAPHQLQPGTVLRDQYVVGRVLGQGGFGITYIGWDKILEIPVAIKEYYPMGFAVRDCMRSLRVEGDAEFFENSRKRFLREARSLAQLSDVPEVVQVRNFFEANNTAYIVMEYLSGITLKEYIARKGRNLTPEETFAILKPVIQGLKKTHQAELVHRDISPDNIMITGDGHVKILDFGAVREVVEASLDREPSQSTEAILKHGFAPLEQYQRRGTLGPWTDVYALCATVYYCLTRQRPQDSPGLLLENARINWKNIPGLTHKQVLALTKGTELLPKDRLHSVAKLESMLFEEEVTKTDVFPPPETQTPPGRNKIWIAAVAVLVVGAFAAGQVFRREAPPVPDSPGIGAAQEQTAPETEAIGRLNVPPETILEVEANAPKQEIPVVQLRKIMDSDEGGKGTDVAVGSWKDTLGEWHTEALYFWVTMQEGYSRRESVEYAVDGEFTKLSGVLCAEESAEEGTIMYVNVWLDGKLVFTSEAITRDTRIPFSVDIAEADTMKIECFTQKAKMGHCLVVASVH